MYKPISRGITKIQGYIPRFNVSDDEPREEYIPRIVSSPIIEDDEDEEIVIDNVEESPVTTRTSSYSGSGYDIFKQAYKQSGVNPDKFNFFAKLASKESGFNPSIQNKFGAPAYGYFQFMQGSAKGRSWDNITRFAGTDIYTFKNNPTLQIQAADKLANEFLKGFNAEDRRKAKELGYSDSALVAGAWLGGVGGVRKLLHKGISVNDKHWSSDGKSGVDMRARMAEFNNMFKNGGIIKAQQGLSELKPDNRSWLRKQWDNFATKYNTSTFGNSAPAQILADFTPYGIMHYNLQGDSDSARLAMIPAGVEVKEAEKLINEARKGVESIYKHYGPKMSEYFTEIMNNLRNPAKQVTTAERLAVPREITKYEVGTDLLHDYAFYKDANGETVLKINAKATNPEYIGKKAAMKQKTQEMVGTTDKFGVARLTQDEADLLTKQYLRGATKGMSPKDVYSRIMVYKDDLGIMNSFGDLTENEAQRLFEYAYEHNLFAKDLSGFDTMDDFWMKNKKTIINLFRKLPVLAGVAVGVDAATNSYHNPFYDPKTI